MDRTQVIPSLVALMAALFFPCFITTSVCISEEEPASKEEQTEKSPPKTKTSVIRKPEIEKIETLGVPKQEIPKIEVQGILQKKNDEKADQKTEEKKGEQGKDDEKFTLSFPGDNRVQNLDLFFERRFHTSSFKFIGWQSKGAEFEFSGNLFLTFHKDELPAKESMWETFLASFSDWELFSRSYNLRIKSGTLDTFGVGGYIELEEEHSIVTDPHLHITLYGKWVPVKSMESAVSGWHMELAGGGWGEIQKLWGEKTYPENLSDDYSRDQYGLRGHINIKYKNNWIAPSIMIEYLPRLNFGKYRFNILPELELKLAGKEILCIDKFPFSIVFRTEFNYDSGNQYSTIEPLIEINPWEIRWTQLVRYTF